MSHSLGQYTAESRVKNICWDPKIYYSNFFSTIFTPTMTTIATKFVATLLILSVPRVCIFIPDIFVSGSSPLSSVSPSSFSSSARSDRQRHDGGITATNRSALLHRISSVFFSTNNTFYQLQQQESRRAYGSSNKTRRLSTFKTASNQLDRVYWRHPLICAVMIMACLLWVYCQSQCYWYFMVSFVVQIVIQIIECN